MIALRSDIVIVTTRSSRLILPCGADDVVSAGPEGLGTPPTAPADGPGYSSVERQTMVLDGVTGSRKPNSTTEIENPPNSPADLLLVHCHGGFVVRHSVLADRGPFVLSNTPIVRRTCGPQ